MLKPRRLKTQPSVCVLALDTGGTKCDALLVTLEGIILAQQHIRDPRRGGRDPAVLRRAVRLTLGRRRPRELVLIMLGMPRRLHFLPPSLRRRTRVLCGSELLAALHTVNATCGVGVVAGTGARVAALTRDGRTLSLDALGPVLGDHGSGYQIGLQALRAAVKALRHPRHATTLQARIFKACRARTVWALVEFSLRPHDRTVIAALARIVDEEAVAGDRVARQILRDAARSIAETVADLVDRLGIGRDEYVLVGAGSVAMHSDYYWRAFCRAVRPHVPRFRLLRAPVVPVAGLAALALRKINRNDIAADRLFAAMRKSTLRRSR